MNHYIGDDILRATPGVSARAERARAWSRSERLLDEDKLDAALRFASAFAEYCSPSQATEGQNDRAMQLLLLFLALDDATPRPVTQYVPGGDEWRALLELPALRGWMTSWDELRTSEPSVAQQFRSSLSGYLTARRVELDLDPGAIDLDLAWKIRTETAFVMPWIDFWRISLGLRSGSMPEDRASRVRRLATEMVFVVNDLCSIQRDREGESSSRDLNVVRAYARRTGEGLGSAIEHFVAWYADAGLRLRGELEAAGSTGDPATVIECDLVRCVVDGNRPAHEALLVDRYDAAAGDILARLVSVVAE